MHDEDELQVWVQEIQRVKPLLDHSLTLNNPLKNAQRRGSTATAEAATMKDGCKHLLYRLIAVSPRVEPLIPSQRYLFLVP
jgi:hypothetical protein